MIKKTNGSIIATVTAIVLVAATMSGLLGCVTPASGYTEEEHIARVTRRARERFIDNGEYTDLEVFPLYDSGDKLGYFLIELQPSGYAYVEMNRSKHVNEIYPMYAIDNAISVKWARMVYDEESDIEYIVTIEDKKYERHYKNRRYSEMDESGNPIYYKDSHFKVAGIKDEKRYLLEIDSDDYVPAVKRDGEFINLFSMEVFDSNLPKNQIVSAPISFSYKKL